MNSDNRAKASSSPCRSSIAPTNRPEGVIRFEQFLVDLTSAFTGADDNQIDLNIEKALRQTLDLFGVDASGILEIDRDNKMVRVLHAACNKGIVPLPNSINLAGLFPWLYHRLIEEEEGCAFAHPGQLPPDAVPDRDHLERSGVQSCLAVPLRVRDGISHLMTIAAVRPRPIGNHDLVRLRILGQIIVSIMESKRKELELKQLRMQLEKENVYLRDEAKIWFDHEEILGRSEALRRVLVRAEQVAPSDSTVLILGETGTGKELIAQCIHKLSRRKDRVMVKVNCASLPAPLVESELFGRERGAYTGALSKQVGRFEIANGSTILLDEIAELTPELQAKLLMVLQDGTFERLGSPQTIKVNVRIIAATNRNLVEAVRRGTFREDLFYRLNVFPIHIPPLRDRREDVPLLAIAFLDEFSRKMGKRVGAISGKTMEILKRHHWPGNIRELRNVIEQAVIMNSGENLKVNLPCPAGPATGTNPLERNLRDVQYRHIVEVLEATSWRIKGPGGAAEILGIKPSTLYTKMERLKIPTRQEKTGISRRGWS